MSRGGILTNTLATTSDQPSEDYGYPPFENAGPMLGGVGKGGVQPMPVMGQPSVSAMPAPNVFYAPQGPSAISNFNNTGRLVDSSLLAQQAVLGRQPVSYQPLLTPDNYQNFYAGNQGGGGKGGNAGNASLIPDYKNLSKQYVAQNAVEAMTNLASSGRPETMSDAEFESTMAQGAKNAATLAELGVISPETAQALVNSSARAMGMAPVPLGSEQAPAPVTTIDVNTGQQVGYDAGGVNMGTGPGGLGNEFGGMDDSGIDWGIAMDPGFSVDDVGSNSVASSGGGSYGGSGGTQGVDAGAAGFDIGASDLGSNGDGGGGGGGGSSKIVCTAMNHAYGFGSFRNAIWLAYADKHLTKAHEVGYHAVFLPLVEYGFKRGDGKLNMVVRKMLEWIARHRTKDLRAEMRGTKRDATGRALRFVLEPLCYAVGKLKGY